MKMCTPYLTLDKFSSMKWATYLESLRQAEYGILLCYFSNSFKDVTLQVFLASEWCTVLPDLLGYSYFPFKSHEQNKMLVQEAKQRKKNQKKPIIILSEISPEKYGKYDRSRPMEKGLE